MSSFRYLISGKVMCAVSAVIQQSTLKKRGNVGNHSDIQRVNGAQTG